MMMSLCKALTPFTACDPITAKLAMRTMPPPKTAMRFTFSKSLHCAIAHVQNLLSISLMIM